MIFMGDYVMVGFEKVYVWEEREEKKGGDINLFIF